MKFTLLLFITMLLIPAAHAQDTSRTATKEDVGELKGALDGMNETLLEMKSTVDALKKIKVSGYIQTQYQIAEGEGIATYAGGDFPALVRDRFQVRRGRLKINYDNDLTQYVLQIDVTQNGLGIKDANASIKEPWMRALSLTGGVFDRPFGFEISYSSGNRESPERSRLFQTLFPGERELGAKIEVMPENGPLSYFNLKLGMFNGVLNNANENDRNKDVIGRLGFQLPFNEQNLAIDGGISLYDGKVMSNSKFVYSIDKTTKKYSVDSTVSNVTGSYGRAYVGGDMEVYYDILPFGGSSLRGEYITGQQPGKKSSSGFYNPGSVQVTDLTTGAVKTQADVQPLYIRNFTGWYVLYLQNIGLKNQLIVKYDVYDPNSDVEGTDIGATGSNLTSTDIKYSTLGLGWIYHWDENVKFTVYYDMVTNETVNALSAGTLVPYKDNVNDNVFTLRMQYKF